MKLDLISTPEIAELSDSRDLADHEGKDADIVGRVWQGTLEGQPCLAIVSLVVLTNQGGGADTRLADRILRSARAPRYQRPAGMLPADGRYYL
jgi:hypothetical protein